MLAEETGEHRAIAGEAPTSGRGRVWIVDPLDGTVNYANGLPVFCVSIALVVDGVPTVGVILDPTRDEVFAATADGPATLNGRPVRASAKEQLTDCVISLSLNGRTSASRPAPASARRSASRATWARRRWRWRTSPTAGSTPSSSRAGCRPGTSRRPG